MESLSPEATGALVRLSETTTTSDPSGTNTTGNGVGITSSNPMSTSPTTTSGVAGGAGVTYTFVPNLSEKDEKLERLKTVNSTSFGILQAARTRMSKTEYISCPSCGRTLFDLQETTAMIRKRTDHLKGVKIGIMGCIVNGPGEMADADYGYVGIGKDKIALYRGHTVMKKSVHADNAVDELIVLIKEDGRWFEQEVLEYTQ